ncbi:murein transglycosylase domain-containing protein [Parathalassolituus penaei]|mgnify:CR=1 FL=1|uniref:Murein transglycosylase domain-containing protein n=1 Tax=Parathalassolituus penaei TaxID=2997323 RepID=A0A9X3EGI1_9GAMM|nr:murein transglycosylase domain-containing protein [Parathalassolituus penaei]MCY0967173.1 murein transglycosylase domain-containing protein [Parathalassolituus penaei]
MLRLIRYRLLSRTLLLLPVLGLSLTPAQSGELPDGFADMSSDVQAVILEYMFFPEQANKVWGQDLLLPSPHTLVKYLDDFHTQVIVDFGLGKIHVENRGSQDPQSAIRHAIKAVLLTPADPTAVDLYTAAEFGLTGKPFLAGKVLDNTGKSIEFPWRAEQYADWLVANKLQRTSNGFIVSLDMVSNYLLLSASEYKDSVARASYRYSLPPSLILAIIETESSFNPFAISPAPAYGLMQVMIASAGKDVYERIYQTHTRPTATDLMNPHTNIDIGSGYLAILRDVYLGNIQGEERQDYCIIAAYNGGAGNLLRTFHSDRNKAIARINAMSPTEVYRTIVTSHPKAETRQYLQKVTKARSRYEGRS